MVHRRTWQVVPKKIHDYINLKCDVFNNTGPGFIYISTDGIYVKIGRTVRSPLKRVRWSGGALPSWLIAIAHVDNINIKESLLKNELYSFRHRGDEQFFVEPEKAIAALKNITRGVKVIPDYKSYLAPEKVRRAIHLWQKTLMAR